MLLEDIINAAGTGGGGASAVFVNGKPIAIAGGGGGIFPPDIIVPVKGRNRFELLVFKSFYND